MGKAEYLETKVCPQRDSEENEETMENTQDLTSHISTKREMHIRLSNFHKKTRIITHSKQKAITGLNS